MISLFEIAKSITEADVDDDKIIKYKNKDGESKEMKASSAKKMAKDHPAKIAYDKMTGKGDDDSEKDAGGKLGGSDFERDGGDSEKVDGPSPEDDWDNEQVMTAKIGGEEVGDIINNPNHTNYDKAMDYVMSFNPDDEKLVTGPGSDDDMDDDDSDSADAEDDVKADLRKNPEKLDDMSAEELENVFPSHDEYMEFETLRNQKVLKDRHPKLHKLASQSIQAKQELESLEKELKDKLGSGEFADPFVSGKEDPEGKKKFEDHQQKIKDAEQKREDASNEVYYYQEDNADALDGDNIPYDVEDLVKGEGSKKDESIKVINGKQYKAIKEEKKSNKHILKENYDRFFGDKK